MKKSRIISSLLAVIVAASSVFALASCDKDEKDTATTATTVSSAEQDTTQGETDVQYVPNVTKPEKQPEILEEDLSRINEYATNPNGDGTFVTEIGGVKFVYPEYFADGNSYVAIRNIRIEDDGINQKADAYVNFEVLARGATEDTVKLSYIGYDADGNISRRSQMTIHLFGHNVGDIIEDCRMDFKRETVKLVITEFKEITE